MLIMLKSLPRDCYVNIVGFGSMQDWLYHTSERLNEHVAHALEHYVQGVNSNLGGTQVYEPMKAILERPAVFGYER